MFPVNVVSVASDIDNFEVKNTLAFTKELKRLQSVSLFDDFDDLSPPRSNRPPEAKSNSRDGAQITNRIKDCCRGLFVRDSCGLINI